MERGYPRKLIFDAASKALRSDRQELLLNKEQNCTFKGITAAIDHTPLAHDIKKIIFRHWHLVNEIPGCKDLPRLGLRKTHSIKHIVTKLDIHPQRKTKFTTIGHFRFGACSCCGQAWVTKTLVLPPINFKMELDFFSSCSTRM